MFKLWIALSNVSTPKPVMFQYPKPVFYMSPKAITLETTKLIASKC